MRYSLLILDQSQNRIKLCEAFDRERYFLTEASSLVQAKSRIECFCPDVVVVNLDYVPHRNEFCRKLRTFTDKPVLVLTTPLDDESILELFESGIDAYLTWPINAQELSVKVKALLRRAKIYSGSAVKGFHLTGLEINPITKTVSTRTKSEKLTKKELQVLLKLASEPGRVFSRGYLLTTVWGYCDVSDTRTIDAHIRRLRYTLASLEDHCWDIKTIPTIGFKICQRDDRIAKSS